MPSVTLKNPQIPVPPTPSDRRVHRLSLGSAPLMATPPQGPKNDAGEALPGPFQSLLRLAKVTQKRGFSGGFAGRFPAVLPVVSWRLSSGFTNGFPTVFRQFCQWSPGSFPAVLPVVSGSFPAVFWRFSDGFASGLPAVFQRFCRRFSGGSTAVSPTVFSASSTAVFRRFSGNNASPGSTPVIAGLEQAGFKSWRGGKGGRTFSTEVCHGGDSPRKLSIWPRSDGGFGATCFTAGCKGLELFNRIRHKAGIRPQGPPTASSTARNGAGRPLGGGGTPPRPEKAATGRTGAAVGPSDADRRAYAMRVWQDSKAAAEEWVKPKDRA